MQTSDAHSAVAELAGAYGRQVYLAAFRVLGDAQLAEDVQQGVFLRLLESPRDDVRSWPAYLSAAATRAAIDELRKRSRLARLTPAWLESLVDPADQPEQLISSDERARRLRAALGRIRPLQATCFALRFFQGLEIADIAATLSLTENHVSVTLHRAAESLRARLAPLPSNDEEVLS